MSTSHPHSRLYCIIVHYGPAEPTAAAITALLNGHVLPHQIVIVDHAVDPLPSTPPFTAAPVRVIRPRANGGYGAGFNLGLGALYSLGAKAHDLVIGLNGDVAVEPDTLAQLVRWREQHPEPALIGVEVNEGQRRVAGGGRLDRRTGRAHLIDRAAAESAALPLDYIHGAFFAVPYDVCLRAHGMPEEYFVYWEDVAFSHRVQRLGYPLKLASGVVVNHAHADPPTPEQTYYLVRNGARFMADHGSYLERTRWHLYNRLRWLYHVSRHRRGVVAEALSDALRGVAGQRKKA